MNQFAALFARGATVSALALAFSSCSLFHDGKYASQWEIQTDVPDSLQDGHASQGPAIAEANAAPDMNSNLVELTDANGATMQQVNTNALLENPESAGSLASVPSPGEFVPYDTPPARPEILNVSPPPAQSLGLDGELPAASGMTNASLLAEPPVYGDAEIASAPKALSGEPLQPASVEIPSELLVPDAPVSPPGAGTAGTAPAAPDAAGELPLLYGGINLGDFYRDVQKIVESAAAAAPADGTAAPVQR